MTDPYVTPKVRAEAQRYGVDVTALAGTGAGGRIRLQDVHAAAERSGARRATPAPTAPLAAAPKPGDPAFARNPLVDEVLRTQPQVAARATGERPTLFHSGDLPPFTASGIDPQALLTVPWQARHAVAAASTTGEAFRLLELYAEDATFAAVELGSTDPNRAYALRVAEWVASSRTEDELYADMGFTAAEEAERQRAVARGQDPRRFDNDAVARRRR